MQYFKSAMHEGYQKSSVGKAQRIRCAESNPVIFRYDRSAAHHSLVVFRHDNSAGHHINISVGRFRHDGSAGRSQRERRRRSAAAIFVQPLVQSAVGLVFMESAVELAMETSKVESAVRNHAEAKLNQLEHDEPAETMTTSCKRLREKLNQLVRVLRSALERITSKKKIPGAKRKRSDVVEEKSSRKLLFTSRCYLEIAIAKRCRLHKLIRQRFALALKIQQMLFAMKKISRKIPAGSICLIPAGQPDASNSSIQSEFELFIVSISHTEIHSHLLVNESQNLFTVPVQARRRKTHVYVVSHIVEVVVHLWSLGVLTAAGCGIGSVHAVVRSNLLVEPSEVEEGEM
ncbi:hypothetical protein F511_31671 [Dorcoceras hygrometricum]|uniref:Uncharacterized protein n=1 Tax=Dorcoceras hygrometricum TaxID=472368 RepID=A0A2Z7D6N2_9LAMI|nr:hypothetical protein F511_31671 [Dorcoceras hygrometricum]